MSSLRRWERVCLWVAVGSAAFGFLTSAGCSLLPPLPGGAARLLHPLLLLLGAATGLASVARGSEIDRERWRIVEDPLLTSGERDWAHKNAERRRRISGTAFIAAPLMLGYWMAYQIEGEGESLAAQLLPVSALVGSVLGMGGARWRAKASTGEPSATSHQPPAPPPEGDQRG